MATSRSDVSVEIVGGGMPSPEEVAAIVAAVELTSGRGADRVALSSRAGAPSPPSPWRWSGRWWRQDEPDWRAPAGTAHPSRP
jgi:hypothetical protein